jgi:3-oxoacyl-[acyl-carrier protein] reductase
VGDVLGQLADRCPGHVPLAARGAAQAAAARQQGGRVQQRCPAINGSPLSGGYAGAKATQRFITGYAQEEANRAGLGITFTAVLPYFAPLTGVGRPAVQAYAARAGLSVEDFLQQQGSLVTPEIAAAAVVELVRADAATVAPGYRLSGAGLQKLP